ncbi:MAG: oligosaccharide flippase family protein [Bacteroidota bacterium]
MRRLATQGGVYALGNAAVKAGGLLLAPLYLNLLTEEGYGYFALLDATARLLVMVAGVGVAAALLRFLTHEDQGIAEADREGLPFTALITVIGAAGVALGLVWVAAPAIAPILLDATDEGAWLVRLMGLYVCFKVAESVPLMWLRVRERPLLFVGATLGELTVLIGGVYVLLGQQGRGLTGVMEAYVLSSLVGATVLVGGLLTQVPWQLQRHLVRRLVVFGWPLVLAGLASMFLSLGDRYLLKLLTDAATVGIYDWSARLGGVLNLLFVQSFQMAFAVIGLKTLREGPEGLRLYRRVFRHYVIWTGWGVLGLSLLALDVTDLVSDRSAYFAADYLVLPIALGYFAYGLYFIALNRLLASNKTPAIAGLVMAAAGVNVALNLILIPTLGALGAALATTAAYGFLCALTMRSAQRLERVDYAWPQAALVLGLVALLWGASVPTADWPVGLRRLARSGLIVLYLPLLLLLRLYTPSEVRQAWAWLQARRRS